MAVINLTSEEFADRIEEMLDLASKGDNVLIHHEGKTYTVIPISDEELEDLAEKEKALLNKYFFSFLSANVTPYSVTVKGSASPDPEKSCARRLVRFFQPVPLTVLRIPL